MQENPSISPTGLATIRDADAAAARLPRSHQEVLHTTPSPKFAPLPHWSGGRREKHEGECRAKNVLGSVSFDAALLVVWEDWGDLMPSAASLGGGTLFVACCCRGWREEGRALHVFTITQEAGTDRESLTTFVSATLKTDVEGL